MNYIPFLLRHTPFWAIPLMVIFGEVAYIFWLRQQKRPMIFFSSIVCLCGVFLIYYYVAGGPDKAAQKFSELIYGL